MGDKVVFVALFAALLAIGLCACGQQGSPSGAAASNGQANTSAPASSSSNSTDQQSTSNAVDQQSPSGADDRQSVSGADESKIVRTHAFSTMQEVFDAPGEADYWDANEASYGFAFRDGSKFVLVRAVLPEGLYDQIEGAYKADDMDKVNALIAPLPVYDEYTVESPTARQIEFLRANLIIQ